LILSFIDFYFTDTVSFFNIDFMLYPVNSDRIAAYGVRLKNRKD